MSLNILMDLKYNWYKYEINVFELNYGWGLSPLSLSTLATLLVLACVRETWSNNRSLCENTYELHYCVCQSHDSVPFRASTDAKTKDIINCLYFSSESWSSLWKRVLHFQHMHVVFGQSQCTVPVDQSEQSVLVGRRDFVENHAFERGGA